MAVIPPLRPQLNGHPSGGTNCGPKTLQMGVFSRTDGENNPPVDTLRARLGRPNGEPTNVYNSEKAIDGWVVNKKRKPLRYARIHNIDTLKQKVRENTQWKVGKWFQIAVDYGVWDDLVGKSGSPTFKGGHSMGVLQQKKWKDGTVVWLVFDPLEDGRRKGIKRGPVWRPRWKVIKAMESFYGKKGKCYAGVMYGGKKK